MTPFKIRCSAIGQIMGKLKGGLTDKQAEEMDKLKAKLDGKGSLTTLQAAKLVEFEAKKIQPKDLPETAKTYCREWFQQELYGKRKELKSKYLDKGIFGEDDAIELVIEKERLDYNEKNEEYFENDFLTGTPDLLYSDLVIDTKCSWDCFTFPLFDVDPDKGYWWQLQGYMDLTGRENAMLSYCLVDMPQQMIEDEIYFTAKKQGGIITEQLTDKITRNRTYSHIDNKFRVKSFKFEYDNQAMQVVKDRVKMCQVYINGLELEYL